jgi:hypothetical protein
MISSRTKLHGVPKGSIRRALPLPPRFVYCAAQTGGTRVRIQPRRRIPVTFATEDKSRPLPGLKAASARSP